MQEGTLKDTGCLYEKNAASKGGVMYLEASTIDTTDSIFSQNYGNEGFALYLTSQSTIISTNTIYTKNKGFLAGAEESKSLGAVYVSGMSWGEFTGGEFTYNESQSDGSALEIVQSSLVFSNYKSTRCFIILGSNCLFSRCSL
jgi:hypothetical protein